MKRLTAISLTLLIALSGAGLAACDEEGPAEQAGEQADEAMEETADAAEEAGDQAGEAMDETADAADEATSQ